MKFDINKILRMTILKQTIIDTEKNFPDILKIFFKCGIVLWHRQQYDKGFDFNTNECDIEYGQKTDEELLENYNKLYRILMLKYG